MKKTLTLLSSTFLTMALANTAQAMKMTVHESVDNFNDALTAPLEVDIGTKTDVQYDLDPSNVMGGQRTTELYVEGCDIYPPECANVVIGMINNDGQLVVNVTKQIKGEVRASVKYGNVDMDATPYEGFLVYLDPDREALENADFELSIKSDSNEIILDSPMIIGGKNLNLFFDFTELKEDESLSNTLSNIDYLELSAFGINSAFDLKISEIGFTFDVPGFTDVPEPSSLMGLASVLGLAIFAKRGKKQV